MSRAGSTNGLAPVVAKLRRERHPRLEFIAAEKRQIPGGCLDRRAGLEINTGPDWCDARATMHGRREGRMEASVRARSSRGVSRLEGPCRHGLNWTAEAIASLPGMAELNT